MLFVKKGVCADLFIFPVFLKFGKSALHEAALGGHHTIVHRLISGGAKIDLMDEVCCL